MEDVSEQKRKLAEKKWEATGFLKGLTGMKRVEIADLFKSELSSILTTNDKNEEVK